MKSSLLLNIALVLAFTQSLGAQPTYDPTDNDADGVPGVQPAPGPENAYPAYSFLTGAGNLLIDRSHFETFDVSGFTSFLQSEGWTIAEHSSGLISPEVLAPYDVLMIPAPTGGLSDFSATELSAIEMFVNAGNGMWVFHEALRIPDGLNTLTATFGVTFNSDFITDSTTNEGNAVWPTVTDMADHPIFVDVGSFGVYGGCCLTVAEPGESIASADEDAFSAACPSAPIVLADYQTNGRIVFSGDNTPLFPTWYPERLRAEEQRLLQNIANWLLNKPTAARQASWGGLKARF